MLLGNIKVALSTLVIFLTLSVFVTNAQQLPIYSSYMFNRLAYNPAYGGSHNKGIDFTGVYRMQYLNVEGGPRTSLLTGHSKIKTSKTGIGGSLLYDTIGVNTNLIFMLTYAYHMPVTNTITLALGVQAGLVNYQADFTKLRSFTNALDPVNSRDDTITSRNASQTSYNIGVGLYLYNPIFFLSVSSPLLLESQFNIVDNTNFKLSRHYFVSAGVVFPISRAVKIRPTAYLRAVAGSPVHIDFNLMAVFYDRFWLGGTYRTSSDYALVAQVSLKKNYRLGYAFDVYTQASQLGGGHEITLNMQLSKKQIILDDPRYF